MATDPVVISQDESLALSAAEGALGLLPSGEREDAERLIQLCRAHWNGASPPDIKVEAGRLVEVLARRSAQAMPFAALGRALIAELRGFENDKPGLLREFQEKLSLLGL